MAYEIDHEQELLLAALSQRAPQTKEELYYFAKEVARFPCEACKGAGQYIGLRGLQTCEICLGEKKIGLVFSPVAVCPDHDAPLDVLWEWWSGRMKHSILVASRSAGKTRMISFLEHMLMHFRHFSIAHMGAVENQAVRARDYFHSQVKTEPWDDQLSSPEPGMERVEFINGGKIEWLPGTLAQASGPHPELSVLDEVDMVDPEVRQRFMKTPAGPRSQFIEASTHYIQSGTISRILKEEPHLKVRKFCMFESLETCRYDCNDVPLPDGTSGRCPLYETEEQGADGIVRMVPICAGEKARRSQGHIPIPTAIGTWVDASPYTRRVEYLCQKPGMAIGNRAFHTFSSDISPLGNVLPFNPDIQPDVPLEWSHDFNPGVNMKMCSMLLQQAPSEYGSEIWIIDAIVLPTSSTREVCTEFLRRYGMGGSMLKESFRGIGHTGGVWVFGDASGHSRKSNIGDSDYDLIVQYLRNIPGFRLMVAKGSANPPLVDRLNRSNQMLCDYREGMQYRTVKVAPRVVDVIAEFEQMPLGSDRLKDKSDRVQRQLGLGHLSDTFEYWVWARFPNGPPLHGLRGIPKPQMVLGGSRLSHDGVPQTKGRVALASVGGRRLAAEERDYAG